MTSVQLEDLLNTIMLRGNPVYNTPSGAFLEYLSTLASQLNLTAFAEACNCYITIYPEESNFISARTPGIVCNRYFTVLPSFNFEKFIDWSVKTPDWGAELKDGFTSSEKLECAIASICGKVENYA